MKIKYCIIAVLFLIILLLSAFIIYQKEKKTDSFVAEKSAEKNTEVYIDVCVEEIPIEITEPKTETDILPVQTMVFEEELIIEPFVAAEAEEIFFPLHMLSIPPQFDANAIAVDLIYPAIALRAGIEGRVILELFVDRKGMVSKVIILQEEPQGRGFGDAAVNAFTGREGSPALINNEPVSARYRYPVSFLIR